MAHGPVGRKPRRDIAAQDGVNRAIDRREQKKRVGHNLPQRRENAGRVQRQVSAEGKNNDDDETGEQGPNAATDTPRRLLFIHDLRPSSAMRTNAVPTIYNAKNFQEKPGCPVLVSPFFGETGRVTARPSSAEKLPQTILRQEKQAG